MTEGSLKVGEVSLGFALARSADRMWSEEPDIGTQWRMGPDVRAYIGRAIAALRD